MMMHVAVEFPLATHRWGTDAVLELARAIEDAGYDEIDLFEHVTVGHPIPGRSESREAAPELLEPLVTLGAISAVTHRIRLGTGILVLPQRQPVLVAKQVSTLDVLSNGRVRLGVGVGWQEAEYDALEEDFNDRGRRMDEAVALLRAYWRDETIDFPGRYYSSTAMALEPKPPQGAALPIWIGGTSPAALRRVGQLGDGWMGSTVRDD